MEPRIRTKDHGIVYFLDLEKVCAAFKYAGIFSKLYEPPSAADFKYYTGKGLTELQWRLRNLYSKMLEDRLVAYRDYYSANGSRKKVYISVGFHERMLKNPTIAEDVFRDWSERIGIAFFYQMTLEAPIDDCMEFFKWVNDTNKKEEFEVETDKEIKDRNSTLVNYSGLNIYERFYTLLRILS